MAWSSGHEYSKEIPINKVAHGAALTGYQLLLAVGESSGASGVDFHCVDHCLDFPDDLKFYEDKSTTTKLDYALLDLSGESPNRKAIFRVEVPHDINGESGTVSIYCRYRLSGDEMEDSWPATFIAGDDFDFKWTPSYKQIHDCVNVPGVGIFMCTRNDNDITGYIMKYTLDGEETVKQLNDPYKCVKRVSGGCWDSTNGVLWWACLDAPDGETGQTANRASLIKMNPSDMSYEVFACNASTYTGCACCTDGTKVWMATRKDAVNGYGRCAEFDISSESFTYFDQTDDYNFYWCIYAHSIVWFAATSMADFTHADARGVLVEFNPSTDTFTRHQFGNSNEYSGPHHIANDGEDVWLVCTAGIGGRRYVRWDRSESSFDLYQLPAKAGSRDIYLIEYDSDYLWATTFDNDFESPTKDQLWQITPSDGSAKYFGHTIIQPHGICFDDKHRIWLGSYRYPVNTAVDAQRISMPVSGFVFEGSGAYLYNSCDTSGIAEIDLGVVGTDAGIVVTKNALADLNFEAVVRIRGVTIAGFLCFLSLVQQDNQPTPGTATAPRRIVVRQSSTLDGGIQILYWTDTHFYGWNGTTNSWVEDVGSEAVSGNIGTYYIVKLTSTATSWKVGIYNDNEVLLEETDSVLWSSIKDDEKDYWLYFGVPWTDADCADAQCKEFYMRKHPSTGSEPTLGTIGEEETLVSTGIMKFEHLFEGVMEGAIS